MDEILRDLCGLPACARRHHALGFGTDCPMDEWISLFHGKIAERQLIFVETQTDSDTGENLLAHRPMDELMNSYISFCRMQARFCGKIQTHSDAGVSFCVQSRTLLIGLGNETVNGPMDGWRMDKRITL